MRIILAEDDPILGDGLRIGLRQLGFQIDWVRDGLAAERELISGEYAAAVLDLGLPQKDGLDVLQAVRDKKITTPVLILTARDAVPERIRGLDLGADDYLIKPIDLHELAARLRAIVRRAHGQLQDVLQCGELKIDRSARRTTYNDELINLSTREFDLLYALMLNAGRVLSREQLEQQLYSWGYEVDSNTIEVHIHHIRKKISADLIRTVRGVGYTIVRESVRSVRQ